MQSVYQFNIHAFPVFFAALCVLAMGIYVFVKNVRSLLHCYFFFLSLGIFIWLSSTGFGYLSRTVDLAIFWFKVDNVGVMFISPSFFGIAVELTGRKLRGMVKISFIIALVFGFLGFFNSYFIQDVHLFSWGYFPQWKILNSIPFFLFWFGCSVTSFIILYKAIKLESSLSKKNQFRFVLIAFVIAYLGSMDYLATFGFNIYPLGFVPIFIFFSVIAYAIIKYNLMDITLAWRYTVSYIFYAVVTLVVFGSLIYFVDKSFVSMLVVVWLIVLVSPYLHRWLTGYSRSIILKNYEDVLFGINELIGDETVYYKTQDLINKLTSGLYDIIGLNNISFFIFHREKGFYFLLKQIGGKYDIDSMPLDDSIVNTLLKIKKPIVKELLSRSEIKDKELRDKIANQMTKMNSEVAIPFFIDQRLTGILVLGKKVDGSLFHTEEIKKLGVLAKAKEQNFALTLLIESQEKLVLISRRISEMQKMEDLAEYLVQIIMRILNTTYSAVYVYDEKDGVYVCKYFRGDDKDIIKQVKDDEYLIRVLKERRKPLTYADIEHWSEESELMDIKTAFTLTKRLKAEIIVPIMTNELSGFLVIGKKRTGEDYDRNDWSACKALVTTTAGTIRSMSVIERAQKDALTNLYNRDNLQSWFNDVIIESIKHNKPFAVLLADLDFFKKVNDKHGHDYGDKVLVEFSETLVKTGRPTDLVFRMGGEEFLVILIGTAKEGMEIYYKRLQDMMKKGKYISELTVSMGGGIFDSDLTEERDYTTHNIDIIRRKLTQLADDSAYRAKQEGRNRFCFGGKVIESEILTEEGTYRMKAEIIGNEENQVDMILPWFRVNNFDAYKSNMKDAVDTFEHNKPDVVLVILEKEYNFDDVEKILREVKKRSISILVGIVSYDGDIKEKLADDDIAVNRCFVAPADKGAIEDWIKATVKEMI